MNPEEAKRAISRRYRDAADDFITNLEEAAAELAGSDNRQSFRLLLAFLVTSIDGYNPIKTHAGPWSARPKLDWGTLMSCHVPVGQLNVDYYFELRSDGMERTLAVMLDSSSPNERTVQKQREDAALLAVNAKVMRFTPDQIEQDAEACANSISGHLANLLEEMLAEAGHIRGNAKPDA